MSPLRRTVVPARAVAERREMTKTATESPPPGRDLGLTAGADRKGLALLETEKGRETALEKREIAQESTEIAPERTEIVLERTGIALERIETVLGSRETVTAEMTGTGTETEIGTGREKGTERDTTERAGPVEKWPSPGETSQTSDSGSCAKLLKRGEL